MPTITILGTGYVGLTTAALFAAAGIRTYVIDPNTSRLESVRSGKSFFYEEGLDPVVAKGISDGLLIPTSEYKEAVPRSDIVISAVGTPDNPDGSSDLRYIFAAATEAAQYLTPNAIYVQKSTVPVGTGRKVEQLFAESGIANAYVSNPEFLRESTALRDSLWFDRIVVGGSNPEALQKVTALYQIVEQKRDMIAQLAGITPPKQPAPGAYITTSLESAELIKVVANAFLALKISFANSIALLADKTNADIVEVMDGVGADARIVRSFLYAGRGYGGGCFPKDVSGLIATGLEAGVNLEIMRASQTINEFMPKYIIEKLQEACDGSLKGRTVAVLGLAFKPGTSDTRRSPAIALANLLCSYGAKMRAYDPKAHEEASMTLDKRVALSSSITEAIEGADAVVIATDWPEFVELDPRTYKTYMSGVIFLDAMNCFDPVTVSEAGLQYIGVGRGIATGKAHTE